MVPLVLRQKSDPTARLAGLPFLEICAPLGLPPVYIRQRPKNRISVIERSWKTSFVSMTQPGILRQRERPSRAVRFRLPCHAFNLPHDNRA